MNTLESPHWSVNKNSPLLTGEKFLSIIESVGWSKNSILDVSSLNIALKATTAHYSVWDNDILIGVARVISDFYLFSTIPEILVSPQWQRKGIGQALMNHIKEDFGHTVIFFGSQSGKETFYEKLGYKKGSQSYERLFFPRKKIHKI